MSNNTQQLPAEVVAEIKLNAKAFAAGMWPGKTNHDSKQREYVAAVHEAGATEYAIKLNELQAKYDNILATESGHESKTENVWQSGYASGHEAATEKAQQEITQLKQWKAEASEILNPILEYGQSKEAGIPLGESITKVVLERCKRLHHEEKKNDLLEEALEHWNKKATGAIDLLKKFISRHKVCLELDPELNHEIKNFLDGK